MNKCALLVFSAMVAVSGFTLHAEAKSREIKSFSEIKHRCHFDNTSKMHVCDVTGIALTKRASKIVASENRPTNNQISILRKQNKHIWRGKQAWAAPGVCLGRLNPDGSCPPSSWGSHEGFVGNKIKAFITDKVFMTLEHKP